MNKKTLKKSSCPLGSKNYSCLNPKVASCVIKSIEDIQILSRSLGKDWIFRGHADARWKLESSLERNSKSCKHIGLNEERSAIEMFKNYTKGMLYYNSHIEWLSAMQHYGVPTRLLDFTESLYIALFFAFALPSDECESKNRAIWAFKLSAVVKDAKDVNEAIDKELKKRCEDFEQLNKEEQEDIRKAMMEQCQEDLELRIQFIRNSVDEMLKSGVAKIPNGIIPIELPRNNRRLIAQRGLFLMPTSFNPFEENLSSALGINIKDENLLDIGVMPSDIRHEMVALKILICNSLKDEITQFLDSINMTPQNIYPDIAGVARYVSYVNGK